jgi:hypothetical protein
MPSGAGQGRADAACKRSAAATSWPSVSHACRRARPSRLRASSESSRLAPSLVRPATARTSASRAQEPATADDMHIRQADISEYWAAADLHVRAFMPHVPADGWSAVSARVDRCVALQINDDLARRGAGRYVHCTCTDQTTWRCDGPIAFIAAFRARCFASAAQQCPSEHRSAFASSQRPHPPKPQVSAAPGAGGARASGRRAARGCQRPAGRRG